MKIKWIHNLILSFLLTSTAYGVECNPDCTYHEDDIQRVRLVSDSNNKMLHLHPHNNNVGRWGNWESEGTRLPANLWKMENFTDRDNMCDAKIRLTSSTWKLLHRHGHNNNVGGWGNRLDYSNLSTSNKWTVSCVDTQYSDDLCGERVRLISDNNNYLYAHGHNNNVGTHPGDGADSIWRIECYQ